MAMAYKKMQFKHSPINKIASNEAPNSGIAKEVEQAQR